MNWLSFFSSILDSLAWPVAVIIIVFVLKKPLSTLLPMLRNLNYKGLQLTFGEELKKVGDQAKHILSAKAKPREIREKSIERNPSQMIREAESLFEEFPEPAVALAWSAVEAELMEAIMRTASSPDYPPHNSALKNAIYLEDAGYLGADKIELIKRMSNLRNIAVHGHKGIGPVTVDEAREFIALVEWLVKDLKEIKR